MSSKSIEVIQVHISKRSKYSFIWIEGNSYYSSKRYTDYITDITKIEEDTQWCIKHEEHKSSPMTLHHYPTPLHKGAGKIAM
jgi:hypothetical protein